MGPSTSSICSEMAKHIRQGLLLAEWVICPFFQLKAPKSFSTIRYDFTHWVKWLDGQTDGHTDRDASSHLKKEILSSFKVTAIRRTKWIMNDSRRMTGELDNWIEISKQGRFIKTQYVPPTLSAQNIQVNNAQCP